MTDTSAEVREQLLPEHIDRHSRTVNEQTPASDSDSSGIQQVDDVASKQGPRLRSQSPLESKVSGWPDRPLPLAQTQTERCLSIALDSALLIIALLFLALAAAALAVSGRGIGDKSGELIEQATRLGPTVFPIVFAALMGRALKAIGRFKSEKGIEVTALWAFLSTKTVFDAFLLQWSVGALSLPTIVVGLLWAMSPAGGQASLRIQYRTEQATVSSTTVRYLDTGPLGFLYTYVTLLEGYDIGPNQTGFPFSITSSFGAALMQDSETKSGPRDSWGNPKIPRLDMLNHSAADENGWIETSNVTSMESFGSLFGLPLLGVPENGTVEFGVESAYVQLRAVSVDYDPDKVVSSSWDLEASCPSCIEKVQDLSDWGVHQGRAAQLLGPPWIQPNSTQLAQEEYTKAGHVLFKQSQFETKMLFEATQVLVETHIVCEEGNCKATKVRPSTTDHRPQNITALDLWGVLALDILNQANGQSGLSPTMLELFMNGTSTIPVYRANNHVLSEGSDWIYTNLARREPETLANRATILLNTAMNLLYSYYGFAGGLPGAETTDYGPPHIPANGLEAAIAAYNVTPGPLLRQGDEFMASIVADGAAFIAASTEASVTRKRTIYRADYAYVLVLVVSSMALIIIGSVGIATGLWTRGPDVFDPLMGLTYNNGSLGLPSPGSTLDTNTRAKLLRGTRVRLGDVSGGESVGMIGMGRAPGVVPLVPGKLYE